MYYPYKNMTIKVQKLNNLSSFIVGVILLLPKMALFVIYA